MLKRNIQESEGLGDTEYQDKQDEFPSISQEYNSGIEDTPIHGTRLIIPENTPEPEILVKYSIGDESTKYYKYLNIINKDTEK